MEDTNLIVFSLVVEILSLSIATNVEVYLNCLICCKKMQKKFLKWKPLIPLSVELPSENGIEGVNILITRNMRTYLESVRCYRYMFNMIKIQRFRVLGFVTDAPLEILNRTYLVRYENEPPLKLNITDYETCRYVQINVSEIFASSMLLYVKETDLNFTRLTLKYMSRECQVNFIKNSEIIRGRHAIYDDLDLGIEIVHTTTHNWIVGDKIFFVSFITGLPIL